MKTEPIKPFTQPLTYSKHLNPKPQKDESVFIFKNLELTKYGTQDSFTQHHSNPIYLTSQHVVHV